MKALFYFLAGVAFPLAAAQASDTPAPATAPASFSTAATDIGTLMDNPATRAVLDKYIKEMIASPQIAQARGLTLQQLKGFTGDALTDETLAKIDADLATIKGK